MNYNMSKCIHPLMKEREDALILSRLQKRMKEKGMDYLILQQPKDVFYVTGYQPLVGTSFAVVPVEGKVTLVISTLESQDAWCCTKDLNIKEFMSWVFIDDGTKESWRDKGEIMNPDDPINLTLEAIDLNSLQGNIGYEEAMMSHQMYEKFTEKIPKEKLVDCTSLLNEARMRKTPWEISMVKIAASQLERVYEAVAAELKPGMPEFMIQQAFTKYSAEFDELGLLGRHHSFIPAVGPYFGLCGMPRGYTLKEGDIVKFDVGYTYLGFNADIARTYAVGTTSLAAEKIYETLYEANRLAVGMLKPGNKCSDVYAVAREYVESHSEYIKHYPRGHVGHSVGCGIGAEEYPQLSSRVDFVIEPGMTFSVETPYSATGIAAVNGGFNLEDTYVVTEDGNEAFTELPNNIYGKKDLPYYCPPDRKEAAIGGAILIHTPQEEFVPLNNVIGNKPTAIIFLRSYACKLTRYEMEYLKENYEIVEKSGGNIAVVVQSNRGIMLQELDEKSIPFPVICDPKGKLYEKYGILAAENKNNLKGEKTDQILDKANEMGLRHGYDEGNPLQLPGVVYFYKDGSIADIYQGSEGADIPALNEIVEKILSLN